MSLHASSHGDQPLALVQAKCCLRTAAVNYAMARNFPPEPSHHLIYDLGAGSLTVSLVSLRSAMLPDPLSLAETPQLKNVTSIVVHGYGYDLQVGGYVFDRAVRDLLIEAFEATTGKDVEGGRKVTEDKRAMAKLTREAARVKQVLSANTAASARVSLSPRPCQPLRENEVTHNQIPLPPPVPPLRSRASLTTWTSGPRSHASNSRAGLRRSSRT